MPRLVRCMVTASSHYRTLQPTVRTRTREAMRQARAPMAILAAAAAAVHMGEEVRPPLPIRQAMEETAAHMAVAFQARDPPIHPEAVPPRRMALPNNSSMALPNNSSMALPSSSMAAAVVRRHGPPARSRLRTTAGVGAGLSHATRDPLASSPSRPSTPSAVDGRSRCVVPFVFAR